MKETNEPKITYEELLSELEKFKPKSQALLDDIHYRLIHQARSWNPPVSWTKIKKFLQNNFENMDYCQEYLRKQYLDWLDKNSA